eukprot:4106477-Amphidinium_carterae.1
MFGGTVYRLPVSSRQYPESLTRTTWQAILPFRFFRVSFLLSLATDYTSEVTRRPQGLVGLWFVA